jgi:hypothetical protein
MTDDRVTVPRYDTDAYMLVPLTPFEVINLMRAAGIVLETEDDAVLAKAFAYLRDTNGAYLRANPEQVPTLQALIDMFMEDRG